MMAAIEGEVAWRFKSEMAHSPFTSPEFKKRLMSQTGWQMGSSAYLTGISALTTSGPCAEVPPDASDVFESPMAEELAAG